MSTRRNNGSHYENHQRAAELQDQAAHAHRTAELRGRAEHLTPGELSRQEREHEQPEQQGQMATFGHEEIARRAYQLWEQRGGKDGSSDEDWFQAVKELREQAIASKSARVH
ncbi:MAG TPA: DUF2934 domain-containing protein [Bryobacteraceae bacterium]|nr:DUF2934 domain-containing protein [Bryobacteraceae bacterium]